MRLPAPLPRYVRFARTLALVGGLGLAACGDDATGSDTIAPDTLTADTATVDILAPDTTSVDSVGGDTALADTEAADTAAADTAIADAVVDCDACTCAFGQDVEGAACPDVCCVAVGPLAPPDLPVA